MAKFHAEPWIPPVEPPLGRLAMEAADAEGLGALTSWPEIRGNGVSFAGLPTFLCWTSAEEGGHLLLLQAAELGAVVAGARKPRLPGDWLRRLDLASLARPLRRHPALPAGVSVHVLRIAGPGDARVRSVGPRSHTALTHVLSRLTGIEEWRVRAEEPPEP